MRGLEFGRRLRDLDRLLRRADLCRRQPDVEAVRRPDGGHHRDPHALPRTPDPIPPVPAELAAWAGQLELSRLPDELVTLPGTWCSGPRAVGVSPQPGGDGLARRVAAQTAPPPPGALPALDFLAAVVAERRRRERNRLTPRQWVPTAEELPAGWR